LHKNVDVSHFRHNYLAWRIRVIAQLTARYHRRNLLPLPHIISKVLSALPSHSEDSGAAELPSDILQAWDARKEKLAVEAEDAQNRQQKLTVGQQAAMGSSFDVLGTAKMKSLVAPHPARSISVASPYRQRRCLDGNRSFSSSSEEHRILRTYS